MQKGLEKKQKGAAAIEFALVFVFFFAVLYGLVSYSLPFLLVQSFHSATAEAVRRCLAVDPTASGYSANLTTLARSVVSQQLAWMPAALKFDINADMTPAYNASTGTLTVSISYDTSKIKSVIPVLVLPGGLMIPNLPATLTAQSSLTF